MNPFFVSIDWGGSKARIAIVNETGITKRFTTKSANIRLLSSRQLKDMVNGILATSMIAQPAIWLVGAAGAGDKKAAELLETTFLDVLTKGSEIHIYPDYLCNYAAAFAGADGVLCVNGTGSIIYARHNNKMVKSGGFGYLIDRAPSGAYFGRKALQLMLDNTAIAKTEFCKFANDSGLADLPEALLSELYSTDQPQRFLGEYAPILTMAYDRQNQMAQAIIADSLEHMLKQLLECMPEGCSLPVCLYGGLWEGWPAMTKVFKQKLKTANLALQIMEAKFSSDLGPLLYYKNSTDFTARLAAQLKSQEQTK